MKSVQDDEAEELTSLRSRIAEQRKALAEYLSARVEADESARRYGFTPRAAHDEEECRRLRHIGGLEESVQVILDRQARLARVTGGPPEVPSRPQA